MINSRLSRDTKSFASFDFKNEIFKRESERSKKMIKNKTLVKSRSSRRDSENVETKFQRFVVDSMSFIIFASFVTFVSTSFVTVVSISSITLFSFSASLDESIVNSMFEEMNRDVLIRLLTILISFFADLTNVSAADSISIQITTSVINSVITFASESIIEIDFENLNDVLVKKQERRQNLKLKMMNHEQRRVIDDFFFFVSDSTRDSISSRSRASTSSRAVSAFAFSRISRNRRIVVKTKIEETFIVQFVVEENENENFDKNDEELFNCVKCCRVFVSCRRLADVACARCARQKQTCISIWFRFVVQKFFSNYIRFQFDLKKLRSNWRTLKQRFATRSFLSKFLLVSVVYFDRFLRRENESDLIERVSMMSTRNS